MIELNQSGSDYCPYLSEAILRSFKWHFMIFSPSSLFPVFNFIVTLLATFSLLLNATFSTLEYVSNIIYIQSKSIPMTFFLRAIRNIIIINIYHWHTMTTFLLSCIQARYNIYRLDSGIKNLFYWFVKLLEIFSLRLFFDAMKVIKFGRFQQKLQDSFNHIKWEKNNFSGNLALKF